MKYRYQAALALTTLLSGVLPVGAEEITRLYTPQNVPLPAVALLDDSAALNFNPAGAGARDLFEAYVSKSLNPFNPNQFSLLAGIPDFSAGYQQFSAGRLGELRRFSAAVSYPVQDYLSLGLAYHLTQETALANSNLHSFDLGLLFRPVRFLSLGFSARNLNMPQLQGQTIRRSYVAGLGIRPFGERLTLTADAQWDEGDEARAITGLFGLESEPTDGLQLRASLDSRGQFMLGAGVKFNHYQLGYFHGFNGQSTPDALHLKVTNTTFHSALQQSSNHFAYISLHQGLVLDAGAPVSPLLPGARPTSYWNFLDQLKQIETLPRYKGVVLDIGPLQAGLGTIEEIHQALRQVRAAGKQIIVYLREAGMTEHYLASLADKIVMHPMGGLQLKGFAYVLPYYRELLDQFGIEVEFIKVGQYKTGLESYTRTEPSDPTREEYTAVQQDDHNRYVNNLKTTRRLEDPVITRIFSKALFNPQEAREAGLIDAVAYPDQIPELAANLIHQPQSQFEDISRTRFENNRWDPQERIAVVYVSGSIVEGRSGQGLLFGESFSGSDTIVAQIQALAEDARVKGLVLRINSPGGSALASDEIYRALQRYKKQTGHPVIVSMADVAASGGYWIALAGDQILANASTLTGSIGIYAGKTHFKGLFEQLGVRHSVIKSAEKADAQSDHRGYTEAERQGIQNNLREYYRVFLERVSENRKLNFSTVEQVAQGRVYTGQQAKALSLVDQIGGLPEAIELARSKARLGAGPIQIEHLPDNRQFLSQLPTAPQALLPQLQSSLQRLIPSPRSVLAVIDPDFQFRRD
jgi:protease-4